MEMYFNYFSDITVLFYSAKEIHNEKIFPNGNLYNIVMNFYSWREYMNAG